MNTLEPLSPGSHSSQRDGKVTIALCAAGEIWGGVELAIQLLAAGLRSRGVDAVAILFYEGLLAERLRADGVPVVVTQMPYKYSLSGARAMSSALRELGVELLHVHGYKASVVGGITAARIGIPVVKTEHGAVEAPGGWREGPGWMRLLAYRVVDRRV
ncbi:MAG: glycosyltransferase, partial [Acidobacteria bacterium]|nr:glycosyltransferase [Acidobacteriota bacterium]